MSIKTQLERFSLIILYLRSNKCNLNEIIYYLAEYHDIQISERTLQRDFKDIKELYGLDIKWNNEHFYYISELPPDEKKSDKQKNNQRLLDTFDIVNILNTDNSKLRHIHFESRKPRGTEHLKTLLSAIDKEQVITLTYLKDWEIESTRDVEPYALKEFKNRWYLLANDVKVKITKIFALDRITEIRKTTKRFFTPKEFDIKSYFLHSFGIGIKDKAEKVVLSFDRKKSGIYIEHLPLHDSQKILIDDENEIRVELYIFLTYDFLQELLSFGQTLTVIEPQILIDKVKEHYQNSLNKYNQ